MPYTSILDWNRDMGYAEPRRYEAGFVGPTRPGDYVGGVNPYNGERDPQTLGATAPTSGGGGGGSTDSHINPDTGVWDDEYYARMNANAQSGHQSMLSAIQRRLDETRNLAKQKISNATGTRDYIVDFINKRYPELQKRVEQQKANTFEDLDTQKTDLQTLYDRANAQARRRSESAALKNRMSARANNRLGSSFYDETVQGNQEGLGRTLGESDLERIGKVAAIGTQKTRAGQEFDNTINDLDTQKNQATYQALDEYKRAVQEGEALERAGVLDFGESEAAAAQNLQSRLDSINQWAQNLSMQKLSLGKYDTGGTFDNSLSGMQTQNQNFLSSNAQTPAGNALGTYAPTTMASPATGGNNINPYANQGVRGTDDILKALGLSLGVNLVR